MLEMLSEALPVLDSVTLCGEPVEPVSVWGNVRLVVDKLTSGSGAGGVLAAPPSPPHPDRKTRPTPTPRRPHSVAVEPSLSVITTPLWMRVRTESA